MKFNFSLIFFLVLTCLSITAFSQSPDLVNYQAVARDLSGNPLVSTPVNVIYEIRETSANGNVVYSESHNLTTNQFGLFTAKIGGGTPISGTFSGINWGLDIHYLQVTINGDVMPSTQLLSVPYALHAGTATSGTPGANGHANLADSVAEPAGVNCVNGGYLIHMGADDNDNNVLEPLERDISYYICNGLDGSVNNNDTSATNELQTLSINGDTLFISGGNYVLLPNAGSLWQSNSPDIYFNTGNVGIGTSTPSRTLSVETSSLSGDGISINNSSTGNPGIEFQTLGNPRYVMGIDQSDNSKFKIGTTNLFTNTRLTINPIGDVGIGTNNPFHRLSVASTDSVIASFVGTNPNTSIVSIAGFNPNSVTGTVFLTGTDSAIIAIDPALKTFFLSNTTTNGHIAITADSSVGTYAPYIHQQGLSLFNQVDSIFHFSSGPNGVFHVNQGSFVTDSLYVVGANPGNFGWLLADDGFGQAVWTDPNSLGLGGGLWQSNTPDIYFNTGNVGLGTSTPTSTLTINSVPGNDIEFIGGSNADIRSSAQLLLLASGSASMNSSLATVRLQTANIDRMTILNTGEVGLGTSTPQQLFTLSTPGSTTLRMERTNATAFDWEINVDNLGFHLKGGADAVGPGLTDFLNVDGSGKVGLGITTPTQKLHIFGGTLRIDDGVNPYNLPVADGVANQVLTTNGAGVTSWQTPSGGSSTFLIDADGDTEINVEAAPDQDVIHFSLGNSTGYTAAEYFTMIGPRLEVINSGNSVFIGQGAGDNDDLTNNLNTFIGHDAGNSTSNGVENVAIGSAALFSNVTGMNNTAIGREALRMNTSNANTAVGYRASQNNTTGVFNASFGYEALRNNITSHRNSSFGTSSLRLSTGENNSAFGADAGATLTSGNNNTFIGKSADAGIATLTNATAIGANAVVGQSNSLILGDKANVGIGTSTPVSSLNVIYSGTQAEASLVNYTQTSATANGTGFYAAANTNGTGEIIGGGFFVNSSSNSTKSAAISAANIAGSLLNIGVDTRVSGTNGSATHIGGVFNVSGGSSNHALQLIDGSEGDGKILTSDATGKTTWKMNRLAFEAVPAAVGQVFTNAPQMIDLSVATMNIGGFYNATGSEFIAPNDGIYNLQCQITIKGQSASPNLDFTLEMMKNSIPFKSSTGVISNTDSETVSINITVRLAGGDKISFRGYHNIVGGYQVVTSSVQSTWFSGHLVFEN